MRSMRQIRGDLKKGTFVNIRRSHLGILGIVRTDGEAWAVRYAPDAVVTEALVRRSWAESRSAFRRYDAERDEILPR